MICVIPFHQGDVTAVLRLLKWIKQLEGCHGHEAVLVADAATNWLDCQEIKALAGACFDSVELIATDEPVQGWPAGPNDLFLNAAMAMSNRGPWLWLEPDAVPLRPRWLDMIQAEYDACGKAYLGPVMTGDRGFRQLAGVAVYPPSAIADMGSNITPDKAFDMSTADVTLPKAAASKRIQHFWGQECMSPTFALTKQSGSPLNTFTLDDLSQAAVLFHRNKDGTLIRLLWQRMYPGSLPEADILLVIPFWNGDAPHVASLIKWMGELDARIGFDVLLTYDNATLKQWVNETEAVARRHFRNVYNLQRPNPPSNTWPTGPNFAFTTTAIHIAHTHQRPWLWLEPDAIPLKPGWMDTISREYYLCGKPFYGPIVKQYGHMNGVAVYPVDLPLRIPKTMTVRDVAFDHVMCKEMIRDVYDASDVIQHLWGIENGRPSEVGGTSPTFTNASHLEWLKPFAVVLHRCKDGSLIKMLRSQRP